LYYVKKEEIAQAVAGCELDPSVVREGKERLFEKRWYEKIFHTDEVDYYLLRYWLLRHVSYVSRGNRERAYAKWLVLHFVWPSLNLVCRTASRAEAFRKACEGNHEGLVKPLRASIACGFVAARKFYHVEAGKQNPKIDVASFFQRRGLHTKFGHFWRGAENISRSKFDKSWNKFEKTLKEQ
jgi:hypothetical protein